MKETLIDTYHRLIKEVPSETFRYLYPQFSIKNRLTGIIGSRGVGKTTLTLQYIKQHLYGQGSTFYFSADHFYFNQTTLFEFVQELYLHEDIYIFFIDEIHKYPNWNQELKNIYDSFPKIKIIFSGSSSIDLIKGSYDLSRRAKLYQLFGCSFREYLNFTISQNLVAFDFEDLITNYQKYHFSEIAKLKWHFNNYLKFGYYPYYKEDPESFYDRLIRVIDKTIYEDIASFYNLKTGNLHYFKKILNFLTTIPPGNANVHNIAKNLGIDDKTVLHYLTILNEISLIRIIEIVDGGNQLLRKPIKIYLNNTTLACALNHCLGQTVSIGMLRELFFIQSLQNAGIHLHYSKTGDFIAKDIVFEVGGKNKKRGQLQDTQQPAFLVKDDILLRSKGIIPLYLFGLLY